MKYKSKVLMLTFFVAASAIAVLSYVILNYSEGLASVLNSETNDDSKEKSYNSQITSGVRKVKEAE